AALTMAGGVTAVPGGRAGGGVRRDWEDPRRLCAVREPFISRHSTARIVAGYVPPGGELVLDSRMPTGGVIFSDGIESDFLHFNAGASARVQTSAQHAILVVRLEHAPR